MRPTFNDDFTTVERGLERGYIVALVSLYKDLSVRDHLRYTVQLWGLYGSDFIYLKDIF
jgi:ABC-type Na+ transport system ATPase subunit NatA